MSPPTSTRRREPALDDPGLRPRSHSHSSSSSSRPRTKHRSARRRDPALPERSTKMTLFYVLCAYLFYGIFTRTDEFDHAIKYAAGSAAAAAGAVGGRTLHHAGEAGYAAAHELLERGAAYPGIQTARNGMYTLPFPARSSGGSSRSGGGSEHNLALVVLGRTLRYGFAYPLVALFNTLSFLAHYLSASLVILLYAAHTLLLPLTHTLQLMGGTFLLAPSRLALALARMLYPAYVALGGLLGVGTSLGLGLGWVGRRLEGVIHDKAARRDERRKSEEQERYRDALLEDRRRQVDELEWEGGYASRPRGAPYRPATPSHRERERHRDGHSHSHRAAPPPIAYTYDVAPTPAPAPTARLTRIKFAEPAARTAYYAYDARGDSSPSESESDHADGRLVAYPVERRHPGTGGAVPVSVPIPIPSASPGSLVGAAAGQAFHFHFHQPGTGTGTGTDDTAGRDVAEDAPGVVGPARSLLSASVDGSPEGHGVRRRTRSLQNHDELAGRVA